MTPTDIAFRMLQLMRRRPTYRYFREREESQWQSPKDIRERQWNRITALLTHCASNVPFYRKRFAELAVDVRSMQSPSDFENTVPILEKEDVRNNLSSMHAENCDRFLIVHKTGGTTGEPLRFPRDRSSVAATWADVLLTRSWWGVSMGDPKANFWSHYSDATGIGHVVYEIKDYLKNWIMNTNLFSAYEMSDAQMRVYADKIRRLRPKVVYGYVSALETFARFLTANGLARGIPTPKVVIVTSEVLLNEQRSLFESVFQCPVANEYGSCEGGLFAFECPDGGFHIMEDSVYLEVVNASGRSVQGEPADVLVTQLNNFSVPLIRYRVGDVGELSGESCSCGRGWSLLQAVKGRKWGILYGLNGNRVYPQLITQLVMVAPQIVRFQAIQDSIDHVRILVQPRKGTRVSENDFTHARHELIAKMGIGTEIEFQLVDSIGQESSGKFEVVKSAAAQDFADMQGYTSRGTANDNI